MRSKTRAYVIPTRRANELKDYLPAIAAAKSLRIRRLVFMRLLASGKIRGVRGIGGEDKRQRYYVASSEVERAMREKPWARKHSGPQAMRRYKS